MPISGIAFTIVGIVLLVTASTVAGIICLALGLGLIGYALMQRSKGATPSA